VFGPVADTLSEAGRSVVFFEPGRPVPPAEIRGLSLLVNKKLGPETYRAMAAADRLGVPTWNGYPAVLLGARAIGMQALERAGFAVPETTREPPIGPYVAKPAFDWHLAPDPEPYGEAALYQPLLPADPIDYKYYAIDDGRRIHVRVLRARSKLYGDKEPLDLVRPDPVLAARVRGLMRLVDAQALGIDVVYVDGQPYAVDVNPAMSFRHTGLEAEIAASLRACMTPRPGLAFDEPLPAID
jgi:hypothetical protein